MGDAERHKGKEIPKSPKIRGAAARNAAGEKLGGRPKGVPNKTTQALKDAILMATEQAGMQLDPGAESGTVAYLVDLAVNHKPVFGGLLKSVLPLAVNLGDANGDKFQVFIQFPEKK